MSVRFLIASCEELFEVERPEAWLELQYGGRVATAIHVIRGREQSQGLLGVEPVEASLHHLVCSDQQIQSVVLVPLLSHILPEGVSRPPGTDSPATVFLLRVAPGDV